MGISPRFPEKIIMHSRVYFDQQKRRAVAEFRTLLVVACAFLTQMTYTPILIATIEESGHSYRLLCSEKKKAIMGKLDSLRLASICALYMIFSISLHLL